VGGAPTDRADQVLDAVGGGQRAAQGERQRELHDRERLFETLAQAGRGVLVAVALEPRDQRAELLARWIRRGRTVRLAHRREHVPATFLPPILPNVPPLLN